MNPFIHYENQKTRRDTGRCVPPYHSWFKFLAVIILVAGIACQQSLPKKEGFLYLRLNTNPTTLDPALIVDVTGAAIGAKLFNGLVRFDRDLILQPDIAEKWDISPDLTTKEIPSGR